MLEEFAKEIYSKLWDLESKIMTTEKIIKKESDQYFPVFEYTDFIFVQMKNINNNNYNNNNNNNKSYSAIDDIFESVTDKYYMKVWDNGVYHDVNIDKIESVTIIDNDSYIVNNWDNIKRQLERKEKIKRLTK